MSGQRSGETSWNYRVVITPSLGVGIYEVHYTDSVPTSWAVAPVGLGDFETVEDLEAELAHVQTAFTLAPLYVHDDDSLREHS